MKYVARTMGPSSQGGTFFRKIVVARPVGHISQGGNVFFREILVACPVGPCCQVEE